MEDWILKSCLYLPKIHEGIRRGVYRRGYVVFKFYKNEEITFPSEFIFVFVPYFIGALLSKNVAKSGTLRKKIRYKPSAHYGYVSPSDLSVIY